MCRKLLLFLSLALCIGLLVGCSKNTKLHEGVYEFEAEDGKISKVIIQKDGKYLFDRATAINYQPSGDYKQDGEKLILIDGETEYNFTIKEDTLIYEDEGKIPDKGSVFKFVKNKK